MKKLALISKLYNFSSKVLKNFPKAFFFFMCFFLLISLTSIVSVNKVYATGVVRLKDIDNNKFLEVYYLGSRMGSGGGQSFIQVTTTGGGCFWYGVKDRSAPGRIAYDLTTDRFDNNYKAINPIPRSGDIAKQVARGGFCSKIVLCERVGPTYQENISGVPYSFEYFAMGNQYSQIGAERDIAGDGPVTKFYRDGGTVDPRQGADPPHNTYDVVQCNLIRKERSGGTWVTKNGIFETCEGAVNDAHVGLNSSMICAKFMCDTSNRQVLNDWDNTMNNGRKFYQRGMTERDAYTCPWLEERAPQNTCQFGDPDLANFYTNCIYDANGIAPGDCWNGDRNNPIQLRTRDTNEIGLRRGLADKRIFCGNNNIPVACPLSVQDYPDAFQQEGSPVIKPDSGCTLLSTLAEEDAGIDFPGDEPGVGPGEPEGPGAPLCILQADENCTFGDLGSESNCFDRGQTLSYVSPDGITLNLFCNNRNRTIACENRITTYQTAFPDTTSRNGTFIHDSNSCTEFNQGMEEIPERPIMDCELDEDGLLFGVGLDNNRQPFNQEAFRQCVGEQSRRGNPQGAVAFCTERLIGPGGQIEQCTCDVAFNPNYNFWRCNIIPDENDCSPMCILQPAPNAEPQQVRVQREVNPTNVIRSIADFLFALAVLIFIINLLRASFMYVTSGGDEGKMKEAQSIITNTIFGMVFIVFIGALLRWVIGVVQRFIQ